MGEEAPRATMDVVMALYCPHGVRRVPSCSGHGRFLCTVGFGHVCMPDPCKECRE